VRDITFEDGTATLVHPDTGVTKNVSVVQETASPLFGQYAARVPSLANAYLEQSLPAVDDLTTSFYLRLGAMPSVDNRILQLNSGTVTVANLWLRANGTLCLKYANTWSGGAIATACTPTATPLTTASTYRIVLRQRRGDGTSNAIVSASWARVDPIAGEQPLTQFTSTSLAPTAAGYWTTAPSILRLGATLSGTPLLATLDDIKLDAGYVPPPSA
jgi:hypothetical protein